MYKLDKIENMFDFSLKRKYECSIICIRNFEHVFFAIWRGTMEKNEMNIEMTNEEYKRELSKIWSSFRKFKRVL